MQSRSVHLLFSLIVMACAATQGQEPAPLPGRGLAQHPFLYCGEWQGRSVEKQVIYLVRDGRVVWSFTNERRGELGDCTMLSNGNILYSRQFGASEITPDKKIVWDYDGTHGHGDSHHCIPLDRDRVLIMQNGDPAKALIIEKATNRIVREIVLAPRDPRLRHGQFRHIRMTKAGTLLVAHMDLGKWWNTTGAESNSGRWPRRRRGPLCAWPMATRSSAATSTATCAK